MTKNLAEKHIDDETYLIHDTPHSYIPLILCQIYGHLGYSRTKRIYLSEQSARKLLAVLQEVLKDAN